MNIVTLNDLVALFSAGGAGAVAINNSVNAAMGAAFGAGGPGTVAINNSINAAFGAEAPVAVAINNSSNAVTARLDNMRFYARNHSIIASTASVNAATLILVPILKVHFLAPSLIVYTSLIYT